MFKILIHQNLKVVYTCDYSKTLLTGGFQLRYLIETVENDYTYYIRLTIKKTYPHLLTKVWNNSRQTDIFGPLENY